MQVVVSKISIRGLLQHRRTATDTGNEASGKKMREYCDLSILQRQVRTHSLYGNALLLTSGDWSDLMGPFPVNILISR